MEWFHPWSEQATLSVAIAHLADLPSSTTLEVENVATYLAGVHRSVRKGFQTERNELTTFLRTLI